MNGALILLAKIAFSSLASASIGALITATLIHFWPSSTARISFSLWLSIFVISFIGVFTVGIFVIGFGRSFVDVISSPLRLFWVAGIFGSFVYFMVNLGIAALVPEGALASFFSTRAFLVPLVVGFIFGSLFGLSYYYVRNAWLD